MAEESAGSTPYTTPYNQVQGQPSESTPNPLENIPGMAESAQPIPQSPVPGTTSADSSSTPVGSQLTQVPTQTSQSTQVPTQTSQSTQVPTQTQPEYVPQGANSNVQDNQELAGIKARIQEAVNRNPQSVSGIDTQALAEQLYQLGLVTAPAPTSLTAEQQRNLDALPKCEKCGKPDGLSVVANPDGNGMSYACSLCGNTGQEIPSE